MKNTEDVYILENYADNGAMAWFPGCLESPIDATRLTLFSPKVKSIFKREWRWRGLI
jgi:hypothetical protein